jgi:hypothetical protein
MEEGQLMPAKKKTTTTKPKTKPKASKKSDALIDILSKLTTALDTLNNKVKVLEEHQDKVIGETQAKLKSVEDKGGRVFSSIAAQQNDNPFIKPHLVIAEQSKSGPAPKSELAQSAAANKARFNKTRFELWSFDEYNQGSIVQSNPDMNKILAAARTFVTEQNVNNALASGEKDKAWEAYFPVVFKDGEPDPTVLYGGNKRNGKHHIYVNNGEKWELQLAPPDLDVRFYLGVLANGRTKTEWYLTNHHGKLINSLDDMMLDRKTVLFVKAI